MKNFFVVLAFVGLVGCSTPPSTMSQSELKLRSDIDNDLTSFLNVRDEKIADLQKQVDSITSQTTLLSAIQSKSKPSPTSHSATPVSAAATPVGVEVSMSDGSTQIYPLGVWIEFASGSGCSPACTGGGQLRGIFPTQYVDQLATVNTATTLGSGASVTAVAAASNTLTFTIASGGTGYYYPIITITGGAGTPGLATATVVGGVITGINAPNASGYNLGDVLSVSPVDTPVQTWTYTRAGRNVQVWRNGLLQRLGPDYSLNQAARTITPAPVISFDGTTVWPVWDLSDYVTVDYLF